MQLAYIKSLQFSGFRHIHRVVQLPKSIRERFHHSPEKKSRASKAGGKRLLVLKAHGLLGSREAGALPGSSSVGLLSCLECGQWQACDSGLVGAERLRAVDYVQA